MAGMHRDETGEHQSLEEAILKNIDQAAATSEAPAKQALDKVVSIQRIAVAGIVFVIIFACTTVYSLIRVNHIADQNQEYLVSGCESGNVGRANELSFWLSLFSISANEPQSKTKVGIAQRKFYLNKLYDTYPQLDCSKVKSGLRVVIPPDRATESTQ